MKAASATAVLVLVVLSSLSAGFVVVDWERGEAERLERANALLVEEIGEIRTTLTTLETALDQLSTKDERYRLLANLEPLDEDVKLAGIGGPGPTVRSAPLWPVDQPLASLAFETTEELDALVRRAQVLSTSWDDATEAMEDQIDEWERTPSILPTDGHISSGFSHDRLHPILNERRPHQGIDVVARRGTPVVAAAKGTVIYAGDTRAAYGYMIDIDHGNGIVTRYAHLEKNSLVVRPGDRVKRWEKIAEVGATGLVTGPSVHYEVIVSGRPRDPDGFVLGDVLRF
ncbi:MAG: M23 family metallopeptidase [Gemmatimonadota bacterium]